MVLIKKQLVPNTPYKYGRNNGRLYITIHETDNFDRGANAQMHANLQSNGNGRPAAWHWQVDDVQAIQSFTHDFQLWHAGDGRGDGNLNSIAIEICVNSDGDYQKAVQNAMELAERIAEMERATIIRTVQHNHWSGKNCPRFLRSGSRGPTWAGFISGVQTTSGYIGHETKIAGEMIELLLSRGDTGENVEDLQEHLKELGFYKGNIDGDYGPKTTNAVKDFQRANGLTVDGIAGPRTLGKLKAVLMRQDAHDWAKDAQEWVMSTGVSDGTRPQDYVTREEVWTMLYRQEVK